MSYETSKATARRRSTNSTFWRKVFRGVGVDVGPGDDPLRKCDWPEVEGIVLLDKMEGDANQIGSLFTPNQFEFIHASQCMEHLHDPVDVLRQMLTLLKSGGHIVFTVPDFDLYEHGDWPSKRNTDHKTTWSLWRHSVRDTDGEWTTNHIYVPQLPRLLPKCGWKASLQDGNYDYLARDNGIDQTQRTDAPVEAFIEVIIVKLH